MLQVVDSFVEDPTRPIVVVYAVNGANKEKIEDIRDHKPKHLVTNFVDRWSKVIKLQSDGYDLNKLVTLNNASAITLTIPSGVFTTGQQVNIQQLGAGQVTVTGNGTSTFTGTGTKLRTAFSAATLVCTGTNTFTLIGDIE
jgi:hypothetical protein